MKRFVNWTWFNRFIITVIAFNVVVMMIDHHGISADLENFLEITSFVCNIIFIVEMVLKMVGLGLKGYFVDGWNRFDFTLVMISIPEVVIALKDSNFGGGDSGTSGVTALRALRAFRVTRLLRRYRSLQIVVTTVMRSVSSCVYLCLIMLLFIFVYSVLGVQLFSKSFPTSERNNFHGLWEASITVFVVITGERWATIMHTAMESTTPAAVIYFISLFSLGNYIFMNLFIAILIENFSYQHEREMEVRRQRAQEAKEKREARRRKKKAKEKFLSEMARADMMRYDGDDLVGDEGSGGVRSPQARRPTNATPTRTLPSSRKLSLPRLSLNRRSHSIGGGAVALASHRSTESAGGGSGGCTARRRSSPMKLSHSVSPSMHHNGSFSLQTLSSTRQGGGPAGDRRDSRRYSHVEMPAAILPLADPMSARGPRGSINMGANSSFRFDPRASFRLNPSPSGYGAPLQAGNRASLSRSMSVGGVATPLSTRASLAGSSPMMMRTSFNSPLLPPPPPDRASLAAAPLHDRTGERRRAAASASICNLTFASFDEKAEEPEERIVSKFKGKSLWLFPVDGKLRVTLLKLVTSKYFDACVLFVIFCNCVTLCLEGPWTEGESASFRSFLFVSDKVFVVFFCVEAIMKIIAYGFIGDDWTSCECCLGPRSEEEEDGQATADQGSDRERNHRTEDHDSDNAASPGTSAGPADPAAALKAREALSHLDEEGLEEDGDGMSAGPNERALLQQDHEEELAPYIWSPWNKVDFVVCITAILGIFIPFFALFRSLRSLRLIIRNQNIKVVVRALFNALPAIANVLAITSFVFIVFSILGVQLFKGKFYYCSDAAVTTRTACVDNYTLPRCATYHNSSLCPDVYCEWQDGYCAYIEAEESDIWGNPKELGLLQREWRNTRFNFDNVGESFLTLFQVSFAETWADILWLGVDSHSVEESVRGPRAENRHPANALFFVTFMVVGNFFALNLFIGLLIDRFTMLRKQLEGSAFLTDAQRDWVKSHKSIARMTLKSRPLCPTHPVRKVLFRLVHNDTFDRLVMLCILVNVVVMSLYHYGQPHSLEQFENIANLTFVILFDLEACVKIIAYGKKYFASGWNKFDFSLAFLSTVGLIIGNSSVQAFRILRVARILRLIKRASGLSMLFGTLYYSLPSLMNIGLLLLCVYFNFAVLGVQIFGEVNITNSPYLDKWLHFRNMGNAVITLYTISTTEKWNDVMEGVMYDAPDCDLRNDCGQNDVGSVMYFCLFMVIGSLITLNLFITVVLENFNEQQNHDLAQEVLADFKEKWTAYDKKCVGWLTVESFLDLLRETDPPIGLYRPDSAAEMVRHLRFLGIPISKDGKLRYVDAMLSISKKLFNMGEDDMPLMKKYAPTYEDSFTVYHWYATCRIKERWLAFVKKRKIRASAWLAALVIVSREVALLDTPPRPCTERRENHEPFDADSLTCPTASVRPSDGGSSNVPFGESELRTDDECARRQQHSSPARSSPALHQPTATPVYNRSVSFCAVSDPSDSDSDSAASTASTAPSAPPRAVSGPLSVLKPAAWPDKRTTSCDSVL
eukprot:Rhum_TRINITY_DN14303_c21_g1::Rhum_TRINITY_DN14303_c21_g1_i1::g.80076::m.80076/K21862/DSC1, NaCP60E; voltage-gated cation channel